MFGAGTRTPSEDAAGFAALGALPIVDVIVLIETGLVGDSTVSLMVFPLFFAGIAALICRALGVGVGWGILYTVGCGAACWLLAALAGIAASFASPW